MEVLKPHEYSLVNENKDAADIDYASLDIQWGEQRQYEIVSRLGRGKYSLVFQGVDIKNKGKVAIKALRPIRKQKIRREYFMLTSLNHPNIIKIKDVVKDALTKTASFVLQIAPHEDFRTLYPKLSYEDISFYMRELLVVVDYIHSQGIMHRDIKPQNVLIDHSHKSLKLIDFSLAELYYPEKQYSTRVSSLYYKAPELLLGNVFYDYRVDIWAVGAIMAGMIFKKTPFFQGSDELDQLSKLAEVLGTNEIAAYCKENANQLLQRKEMRKQIVENYAQIKQSPKISLSALANKHSQQYATEDALNLLGKLLELDPKRRLTAKEALNHPFLKL